MIQNVKYKINKKIKKVMWYNLYDRILITGVIICKIYNILKIVIYKNNSNNKININNRETIYIKYIAQITIITIIDLNNKIYIVLIIM